MAPSLQISLSTGRGFLAMSPSPYPRFQPCAVLSVRAPCASVARAVCGGFPKHAGAAAEVSTGRHEYVLGCEGICHRLYASFGEQYAITQGKDASLTKYFPIDKSIGGWHAGASYLQNSRVPRITSSSDSGATARCGWSSSQHCQAKSAFSMRSSESLMRRRGGDVTTAQLQPNSTSSGVEMAVAGTATIPAPRGNKRSLDVDLSDSHLPTADSGACTPGQVQRAVICFGRRASQDRTACRWVES